MMYQNDILNKPFDIAKHKETFIDYLEVIIAEDGEIMYAIPSHQEKLIEIACRKLKVTRDELSDLCPQEYYFDFNYWLCKITNCIAVYTKYTIGRANDKQLQVVQKLADEGLYLGKCEGVVIGDGENKLKVLARTWL